MNLLRLSVFKGEERYRKRSDEVFGSAGTILARYPTALPRLLCAVDFGTAAPREVVLAGTPGRDDFEALRRAAFASSRLNRVVAHADTAAGVPGLEGLGSGRAAGDGAAAAYVCSGFACRAPVSTPDALAASLAAP
jgi:uncharacterized protein